MSFDMEVFAEPSAEDREIAWFRRSMFFLALAFAFGMGWLYGESRVRDGIRESGVYRGDGWTVKGELQ